MTGIPDEFADAFADLAEQGFLEPAEALVEKLRESGADRDGRRPGILILIRHETEDSSVHIFHRNGISNERTLWMIEQYRHFLMTGEGEDE